MLKAREIEGKKFMWDGNNYDNEEEAKNTEKSYIKEGFETHIVKEEGIYDVYTRRVVTEIVLEGEAPPWKAQLW